MHVVERRQHADAEETRLGNADFADVLEVSGDRLRRDVLEDHVRSRGRGAPSEKPDQVGMLQSRRNRDFAFESIHDAVLLDPVRPHDFDGDLTEELPIPRAENFIPGTTAKTADHHQGAVDLLPDAKIPALPGWGCYLCHSLTLRPTDGCTRCARHEKRAPGPGALLLWRVVSLLALGRQAKEERGSESHERRSKPEKAARVAGVRGRKVRDARDGRAALRSCLRGGLNSRDC